MKIKENCWRLSNAQQAYFLKKYKSEKTFKKVRVIHETLAPNLRCLAPVVAYAKPYIVFRWVNGRPANYQNFMHCRRVFNMLSALHAQEAEFYHFPKLKLAQKWHMRLVQFQLLEMPLRSVLGNDYDALLSIAKYGFDHAVFPSGGNTLLHGDVAHHNFLLSEHGDTIIDFDLAVVGNEAEEWILWMHRLLPHYRYRLNEVLRIVPELEEYRKYFSLLLFPNELLREWLLFYDNEAMYPHLKLLTNWTLRQWPQLVKQIEG